MMTIIAWTTFKFAGVSWNPDRMRLRSVCGLLFHVSSFRWQCRLGSRYLWTHDSSSSSLTNWLSLSLPIAIRLSFVFGVADSFFTIDTTVFTIGGDRLSVTVWHLFRDDNTPTCAIALKHFDRFNQDSVDDNFAGWRISLWEAVHGIAQFDLFSTCYGTIESVSGVFHQL